MLAFLHAPKRRMPLWAKPDASDLDAVTLKWTIPIAFALVASGIWAISKMDFTATAPVIEKKIMKVFHAELPAPPAPPEETKVIPEPTPPERPKERPKEIKKTVVQEQPKQPEPKSTPETSPIPMEAPAISPDPAHGVSIPTEIGEPSRPQVAEPPGDSAIRRGIACISDCDKPPYPAKALQAGITGEFVVHMYVDASGIVTEVKIISGSPRDLFERTIKRALKNWKFKPTGTNSIVEVPIVFKLEN